MFASMRRYRVQPAGLDEFMRRVDATFADQIAGRPGFVSYELIDCGDGDLFTLSIFREPHQAEASRALARDWTEEHLRDIDHTRFDAVHGESVVGRAEAGMLEASHVGAPRKAVSIRLYRVHHGGVHELLKRVDEVFADRMREMDGFEASYLLDCGEGELLWVSFLREAAAEADEQAVRFVREELTDFRLEHVVSIRGDIVVSRASAERLEPAHA
jgi:heme-degrading monooxygenase HmoA